MGELHVAKPLRHVGDGADGQHRQRAVGGADHFWHHRHPHHVATDDLHHADLGGGLETGAAVGDEHPD